MRESCHTSATLSPLLYTPRVHEIQAIYFQCISQTLVIQPFRDRLTRAFPYSHLDIARAQHWDFERFHFKCQLRSIQKRKFSVTLDSRDLASISAARDDVPNHHCWDLCARHLVLLELGPGRLSVQAGYRGFHSRRHPHGARRVEILHAPRLTG